MSDNPSVFLLSGDLLFASKIRVAVEQLGGKMAMGGKLPDSDLSGLTHVILDLSTRSKLAGEIAAQCQERCPAAKVIAYGPHVQADRLQAARDGGIELVLTNNQFSRMVGDLLTAQ